MNVRNWSDDPLTTRNSLMLPSVLNVHFHEQRDIYARKLSKFTAVSLIYVDLIEFGDKHDENNWLLA